jgi:hypothetical protein
MSAVTQSRPLKVEIKDAKPAISAAGKTARRTIQIESHFFPRMYHNLPPSRPVTMSDGWLRF